MTVLESLISADPHSAHLLSFLLCCFVVSALSSSQMTALSLCVSFCKGGGVGTGRRGGRRLSVSHRMGVYGCVPCPPLGVKLYFCVAWHMYHFCVSMKWGQVNLFRSVMQDTVAFC